jgi:hypothetical protein
MKKTISISIILLLIGTSTLFAQNLTTQRKVNQFTEYLDRFNTNDIYAFSDPNSYEGTPFYHTKFLLGSVYINNELSASNVALRYNVFADEIEFKKTLATEDSEAKAIIKSNDIYVKIEDEFFVVIPDNGYFLVLFDGANFSFLKKLTKKYHLPKESKNTYEKGSPPTFSDRFTYFIYTKEGSIKEFPSSKKKIFAAFGNNEKEIKQYCKEEKLDLKNEDDLKKAIIYLDKLENTSL